MGVLLGTSSSSSKSNSNSNSSATTSQKGTSVFGNWQSKISYGPSAADRQQKAQQDAQDKANQQKQQEQAKQQAQGNSLFNKIKSTAKSFASAATQGEQKASQGVARVLPGGSKDLDAEAKSSDADSKNLKLYSDLHKNGKLNDAQYKKATATVAGQGNKSAKEVMATEKSMPTKTQIGLGFASTAADILTAGALPEIKGAMVGTKVARVADAGIQVAGNATAAGLNAAAAGGTKGDIIKNAAAGVALPAVLHLGGETIRLVGDKYVDKFGKPVSKADAQKALTTAKQNSLLDKVKNDTPPVLDSNTEKSLQTVMADIHQPKAALQADAAQKAATEAAGKQTEQAAKDSEKAATESKKIDQQLEILTAKAKDAKDGKLSNVDQVKVKQLQEQKAELEKTKNADAVVPTTTTAAPSESAAPTIVKAAPGGDIPKSESSVNSTPKISNRQQTEIKPNAQEPVVVPIKEDVKSDSPEIGVSKLAQGVEANAIKKGLTEGFADKPEYAKVNIKQQADAATQLVKSDPERAIRIAMGHEQPPEGLLPESAFIAVEHAATKAGNTDLLRKLATESHLTTEATGMGQRIRMLGERDVNSSVANIKRVKDVRVAAFEKKTGKTATKAVSEEIRQIRAAKPKVTKETFSSFVESLKC